MVKKWDQNRTKSSIIIFFLKKKILEPEPWGFFQYIHIFIKVETVTKGSLEK